MLSPAPPHLLTVPSPFCSPKLSGPLPSPFAPLELHGADMTFCNAPFPSPFSDENYRKFSSSFLISKSYPNAKQKTRGRNFRAQQQKPDPGNGLQSNEAQWVVTKEPPRAQNPCRPTLDERTRAGTNQGEDEAGQRRQRPGSRRLQYEGPDRAPRPRPGKATPKVARPAGGNPRAVQGPNSAQSAETRDGEGMAPNLPGRWIGWGRGGDGQGH